MAEWPDPAREVTLATGVAPCRFDPGEDRRGAMRACRAILLTLALASPMAAAGEDLQRGPGPHRATHAPGGAPASEAFDPRRSAAQGFPGEPAPPRLYYHVFVRSFADSDGDRIGDLRGLASRIDYLKSLHVTHVLLTPIQASPFYHNYFSTDFDAVDPAYGGNAAWVEFVRAAHSRGLKVILDEEFQYVAEGHPWWRDQEGRPGAPEGRFVLWNRRDSQRDPEPFLGQLRYRTHDGRSVGIAMVDLSEPTLRDWFRRYLHRWADPLGNGSLVGGVDGYRIDHMMDDLDAKHRVTNLFGGFWKPIFEDLRTLNPSIEIIAEQYDWKTGEDFLRRGGAGAVFAFPLREAIVRLDKRAILEAFDRTVVATPPGRRQLVFLENHDVDRFASLAGSDPRKLRAGAVLGLTLGRDAIIYYGQEIGMRGMQLTGMDSDGAQIPVREAFRWKRSLDAAGSAIWYRGSDRWWTQRKNRSADGVSVEEEDPLPESLLNFYRRVAALRLARPEFAVGDLELSCRGPGPVLCYRWSDGTHWTWIAVNLGPDPARAGLPAASTRRDLLGDEPVQGDDVELPPWGVRLVGSP